MNATAGTPAEAPSLDVVVVNWNTGDLLRKALESVAESDRDGIGAVRAFVVDNGSADGSWEGIESSSIPVSLTRNDANRGFAAACNQGAAEGGGDYLLFLNPDMRLRPDTLASTVAFMQASLDSRVGICGIRLVGEGGEPTPSCARGVSLGGELTEMTGLSKLLPRTFPPQIMRPEELTESRYVEHVAGAYFLIRRPLFERLGGFDERFFLYCDEADLALRAKHGGWSCYYLSDVIATHVGHGSSRQVKAERLFHMLRSRNRFIAKHQGRAAGALHVVLTAVLAPIGRLAFAVARGSETSPRDVIRAYRAYYASLLRSLRGRETGAGGPG